MPANPTPASAPPNWPHCGHGADETDLVGCRGVHVPGHTACLAHLSDSDRAAYLAALHPGSEVDHRGTHFTQGLVQGLLNAVRDPQAGHARLGDARFEEAIFSDEAPFHGVTFAGPAWFSGATFVGAAQFSGATFRRDARFGHATFTSDARFEEATFHRDARFGHATFTSDARFSAAGFVGTARFGGATFAGTARFGGAAFESTARFHRATFQGEALFGQATFASDAGFEGARFSQDAGFRRTRFTTARYLGPLLCSGELELTSAVFGAPVTVEAAARTVSRGRTQWQSRGTLRLRYAELDLSDAVFDLPLVAWSL